MITDYFMITEKSNQLQVIVITDYDYPNSGTGRRAKSRMWYVIKMHPIIPSSLSSNILKEFTNLL